MPNKHKANIGKQLIVFPEVQEYSSTTQRRVRNISNVPCMQRWASDNKKTTTSIFTSGTAHQCASFMAHDSGGEFKASFTSYLSNYHFLWSNTKKTTQMNDKQYETNKKAATNDALTIRKII